MTPDEKEKFRRAMELQDAELAAVEHLYLHRNRLRFTAPVDDDFPMVKHDYDGACRNLIEAFRANGRIK